LRKYEFHEAASVFSLLEGVEFAALLEDIKQYGVIEPVWLYQGRVLDGRKRVRACEQLGIEPPTRMWTGDGSPLAFVVSENLKRRHLSESERAAIMVELLPRFKAEAKERQRQHGGTAPGNPKSLSAEMRGVTGGKAVQIAANAAGVSPRYVEYAAKLKADAPGMFKLVGSGQKTITEAIRELRHAEQHAKVGELPAGKYRVIYADPPYAYNDKTLDKYGPAERHYPTMSIEGLCALPVGGLAADDAVLFLWSTAPMVMEANKVIEAWAFRYKGMFVWDKVKHNFGHYNSVRHELLLVATRGTCTPDTPKLFDSVVTAERSSMHSEKPEVFRQMIDELYPHGRRIELFARRKHERWEGWGAECPALVKSEHTPAGGNSTPT
jgi:N6-adenosine-specific RNA methylase IME4